MINREVFFEVAHPETATERGCLSRSAWSGQKAAQFARTALAEWRGVSSSTRLGLAARCQGTIYATV